MTPTVAELRDDSAIMVLCAMPDPGSHRSAYAIAECHRLFDCCRSPHEALDILIRLTALLRGPNERAARRIIQWSQAAFGAFRRRDGEALLIPALAIWSALTGGTVRCREDLPRFGRVGFLVEHPKFQQSLVIECDGTRRVVARDRELTAAGYAVCRLVMTADRAEVTAELDAAFRGVDARLH